MLGVIGLDTEFYKPPGHVRNPTTFKFPILIEPVSGATTERMVGQADASLEAPFIAAARKLEARGATVITGGCGYMILFQQSIGQAVSVPTMMSSLILLPAIGTMLPPNRKIGVIVADETKFSERYLQAANAQDIPVKVDGMSRQPEFSAVMLRQERADLDFARLEDEVVSVAARMVKDDPTIWAILLECTDLAPFAHAIQNRTGLPIFDITTLANLVVPSTQRSIFRDAG